MSLAREFSGMLERIHLALTSDELGQPAPGGTLQACAQRPESGHFVHFNRGRHASEPRWAKGLECKVALAPVARRITDGD